MQKSSYIEQKVADFARQLQSIGVTHLTIYITGSLDLFSPCLPVQHIPYNNWELLVQEYKITAPPLTSVIVKANQG